MRPDVNVRSAAEVPGEARAFQSEAVPEFVAAPVPGLEEGQRRSREASLRGQRDAHPDTIVLAEGLDQDVEEAARFFELIGSQIRQPEPAPAALYREGDVVLVGYPTNPGTLALRAVAAGRTGP